MMHEHHPLVGREIAIRKAMPLIVRVAADTARFSLRIDPAEIEKASKAFGLNLPAKIGETAISGEKRAICLGPDEWYLTAPLAEQEAVEQAFADLYATAVHSLVDIGHREVGIEIEGSDAVLALQSALAFDIEAMPVGSGCRTIFDKAQIVLLREAENRFRIEVWRSFADHVWGLLQAAGREIELDI
ncbi:heterotetrameric sarcosine oxidase gamma subunit [Pseudaminobacter salicylatoxidans]|uniref:Heterotetrameric sarcosine oxidase gamma subunit n=1 Tax=Pseudaminobacter salicylatoxidans TaxID=93369 RepID=A0A316CW15_PSESE|nr:sarcosine oxidase subunit gamma family protein [Pseudaminobacter salicylatoxidans]PWJ86284.1 heterotetrameric sarcosine oxidase gamma subunit [Pseudaminobacter salicylatoxidans]